MLNNIDNFLTFQHISGDQSLDAHRKSQRCRHSIPVDANQSKIDQYFRVAKGELPGVSILPVRPKQQETKAEIQKVKQWDNVSESNKDRSPSKESGKKRSLDDYKEIAFNTKRRLTVDETTKTVEKENLLMNRRRSLLDNLQKLVPTRVQGERKLRQGLAERTNRLELPPRPKKLDRAREERAKSFNKANIDRVLNLEELTLDDGNEGKQVHKSRFKKHAHSLPVSMEMLRIPRVRKIHVCKSTKLLATLFHHTVSAFPEISDAGKSESNLVTFSNQRKLPVIFQTEPVGTTRTLSHAHTISLPRATADEYQLNEFYQNHERVYRYLFARDLELSSHFNENFLRQNGLTEDLRATLCDWMIKVQQYLELRTETLHLAVSIMDRYTWMTTDLDTSDYQLVGITSLFVAAKFVERFPPATNTLCHLTENSYEPKQVLKFEVHLLEKLNFELAIPLPHHFLYRSILACSELTASERLKVELMCTYFFELSLTKASAVGYAASIRCAAALRLARQMIRMDRERATPDAPDLIKCSSPIRGPIDVWPDTVTRNVGHEDKTEIRAMCLIYLSALKRFRSGVPRPNEKHEAAFQKFSNKSYRSIAQSSTVRCCDFEDIESSLCLADLTIISLSQTESPV